MKDPQMKFWGFFITLITQFSSIIFYLLSLITIFDYT
jgi:hypothetical protein